MPLAFAAASLLLLDLGAAAAATPAPDPAATEQVRKLFDRELAPLPAVAFETASGLKGKVEAKAAPGVEVDGETTTLAIALGTGEPITCAVSAQRVDAATSLVRVVEATAKAVELLAVRLVEVAAVDGNALLFAELAYRTAGEKGPLVGQVSLAVGPHETRSLVCMHDEPGYSATFRRVVKGLAASLTAPGTDTRKAGRYAEIEVLRVGEVPVGYSERVIADGEGGGRELFTWSAQLLPRSATELAAVDVSSHEVADAAGLLVAGTFVEAHGGEIASSVTLTRGDDGRTFGYEGEKAGKKLAGSFQAQDGLATELWFARRFDAAHRPAKAEVAHAAYSPSLDPVAPTRIAYAASAAEPRRATMKLGAAVVTGDLDDDGLFSRSSVAVGPATLVSERVWSRGKP